MFGLLNDIKEFFSLLFSMGNWILLGATIAAVGWLVGRIFYGSFGGFLAAAGIGAAILVFSILGDWLGDDSAKVARLEAANHRLILKEAELRATGESLRGVLHNMANRAAENSEAMADLEQELTVLENRPECDIPKELIDELNKVR